MGFVGLSPFIKQDTKLAEELERLKASTVKRNA
jgi:hypothetical protein